MRVTYMRRWDEARMLSVLVASSLMCCDRAKCVLSESFSPNCAMRKLRLDVFGCHYGERKIEERGLGKLAEFSFLGFTLMRFVIKRKRINMVILKALEKIRMIVDLEIV